MASEDQALVERVLAGDEEAINVFVEQLTPVVQAGVARTLYRWRPSAGRRDVWQEVGDLTQDAFLYLFAHDGRVIRAWRPERGLSLSSWVALVTARNTAAILKSGRRSPWRDEPVEVESLEQSGSGGQRFEVDLMSRDLLREVAKRLRERLSALGFYVFCRLFVDDQTTAQLCQELDMSEDAVFAWRSRLRKAARTIAEELSDPQSESTTLQSDGKKAGTRHGL